MTRALNDDQITSTQPSVMAIRDTRPNWVPMWVCTPNSVTCWTAPHSAEVLRPSVRALNWSTKRAP